MPRWKDRTGERFGRLVALEFVGVTENTKKAIWKFKCDCGNTIEIRISKVQDGQYVSCGCLRKERRTTHGLRYTRLYEIWCGMKKRCYNKSHENYKWYGAKGVSMSEEWINDFVSFYEWSLANGYSDNLTIDRIDTLGNYEPSNCRWITIQAQQWNRRSHHEE